MMREMFQEVFDQLRLNLHISFDDLQSIIDFIGRDLLAAQHLDPSNHGRQRRAQFVRDDSEELVFAAVGITQSFFVTLAFGDVGEEDRDSAAAAFAEPKCINIEPAAAQCTGDVDEAFSISSFCDAGVRFDPVIFQIGCEIFDSAPGSVRETGVFSKAGFTSIKR